MNSALGKRPGADHVAVPITFDGTSTTSTGRDRAGHDSASTRDCDDVLLVVALATTPG
ncbi:hypothetical protein [Nannocystis punicea]|uniref:Uncharacterized protein n=1 Tax=Nannocystis punicea TaxID=2995304 RepID=A0ABY7HAV3_9BACT|nr:hypothetical protein [Nannocystis poenicansa]WAS96245.1 hypothetical protein O0S08_08780 [Nannocystis poenicansa]